MYEIWGTRDLVLNQNKPEGGIMEKQLSKEAQKAKRELLAMIESWPGERVISFLNLFRMCAAAWAEPAAKRDGGHARV